MARRTHDGRFVHGEHYSTATEIRPGQHLSRRTEFKPGDRRGAATEFRTGMVARNKLPVGSETIRYDGQSDTYRAWVKVAEPSKWQRRAVVVWERSNGPVPRGYCVHHKDHDTLNDNIDNLEVMTRGDHRREHHDEIEPARIRAIRRS